MPAGPRSRNVAPMTSPIVWAGTLFRFLLAVILIWAGLAKLLDLDNALRAVRAYRVLPEPVAPAFALALPLVELAVGAALLVGWRVRQMAGAALGLMLLYAAALGQAWVRGLQLDCGCFGAGSWVGYPQEVARDLALALAAAYLAARPRTKLSMEST